MGSASARWRSGRSRRYGAAYVLQEMLTIKSDDTVGRVKAYEAIVKGENIAKPNIPESFKVLMKEIQSLGLDMSVQSEEGAVLEVREEDDDLLRAAEELGIDLTAGLRRQQSDAGELEQAGVHTSALQDVIGAGNQSADDDQDMSVAAVDLLAAAAALPAGADVDEALVVADIDDLPDIDGLTDLLDLDAPELKSGDVETDED